MNIKRIIREVLDKKSTFKRNVYGDNEEYREVEKERVIIWNPNYRVGFQFIFDQKELPNHTFIHLYPYSEDNNFVWDHELSRKDKSKVFIDAIKKLPKVLKNYFKKFGKLDTIVFRPKTNQMGNIYSSSSALRLLESEFGSDYDIEVVKESLPSIPTNSVIMKLKKNQNIDEGMNVDPFKWIRDSDPRIKLRPNTLYYFDPSISGEELEEFTNRFSPGYKKLGRWLRGLTIPVIFFVTDETGKDIQGWSSIVSVKDAMEFYKDYNIDYVDARQYFNI